jgi:hypothetical protein
MKSLPEIKARLAAIQGQWRYEAGMLNVGDYGEQYHDRSGSIIAVDEHDDPWVIAEVMDDCPCADGNKAFLAHAPTDIAALIAEVERLRAWKKRFDYLAKLESINRHKSGLPDVDFLALSMEGVTFWGKTYAEAVDKAMEYDGIAQPAIHGAAEQREGV